MADFEEELRLDDEENAREVEYILDVLPADLKEKYSEADLRYMMDTIVDYYFESGVLEADADEEVIRKAIRDAGYLPLRTKEKV